MLFIVFIKRLHITPVMFIIRDGLNHPLKIFFIMMILFGVPQDWLCHDNVSRLCWMRSRGT